MIVLSQSSAVYRENDGGRLDGLHSEGERRDDRTSTDGTCDYYQRIRSDAAGVHHSHRSSVFRVVAEALNESYGSGQAVAIADVLFLRCRQEPAIRTYVCRSSCHDLLSCRDLHIGGRLPRSHDPPFLRSIGELQGTYSPAVLLPEFHPRSELQCAQSSTAHQVPVNFNPRENMIIERQELAELLQFICY